MPPDAYDAATAADVRADALLRRRHAAGGRDVWLREAHALLHRNCAPSTPARRRSLPLLERPEEHGGAPCRARIAPAALPQARDARRARVALPWAYYAVAGRHQGERRHEPKATEEQRRLLCALNRRAAARRRR